MRFDQDVLDAFTMNERGNSLYRSDDGFVFIAKVDEGLFFLVEARWENYPGFNVGFMKKTDAEMIAMVQKDYCTWTAMKNNLGVPLNSGEVEGLDEEEDTEEES